MQRMKPLISRLMLLALAWLVLPAPAAGLPPSFAAEPPEPAAAALVEAYLNLLALGEYEQALTLTDLRGMRHYLLERRLEEIRTRDPALTDERLEALSAEIQVGDLHPARLRQILLHILDEAAYKGMSWRIRGYAEAPGGISGHVVSVISRLADGTEKPVLLGLVRLGEQWKVAPAVIEQMMEESPVVRLGRDTPPPPEVSDLMNRFWTHFRLGEFDDAYGLMSPAYREQVPQLKFLQQAQRFIEKAGSPVSWEIEQGVATQPGLLFFGVKVQGTRAMQPTLMRFGLRDDAWGLDDIQVEMPRAPVPSASPLPGARPALLSTPDLRPDLRPSAPTHLRPVTPPPAASPPTAARPVRTRPDAPVGPDQP